MLGMVLSRSSQQLWESRTRRLSEGICKTVIVRGMGYTAARRERGREANAVRTVEG